MASIVFLDEVPPPEGLGPAFTARVGDVADRTALFDCLSKGLRFPDYFGRNWDALEDFLRDLSWIPNGEVRIVHNAIPSELGHDDLRTYLEILVGCIEYWKEDGSRALAVSFPSVAEQEVLRLLE